MTPRNGDHEERKDRVLGIVVDRYIKTITPVGSHLLADEYFPDLSSATLRSILAELEKDGYLTHPHTSAGRIPTQLGYRYYVDNLVHEIELLEKEKTRIQSEYAPQAFELEALLEKTSQVVADLTHHTTIVSVDGADGKVYCRGISFVAGYPEFTDLKRIKYLLHMLEEKERVLELINRDLERKVEVFIGSELKCEGMGDCSLVVSRYNNNKGSGGRIAILGPTRMDYERVISTLEYMSDLMSTFL